MYNEGPFIPAPHWTQHVARPGFTSLETCFPNSSKMQSLPLLRFCSPNPGITDRNPCTKARPTRRKAVLPGSLLKETMLRMQEWPGFLHVWAGWVTGAPRSPEVEGVRAVTWPATDWWQAWKHLNFTVKYAYGSWAVPKVFDPGVRFLGRSFLRISWYFESISLLVAFCISHLSDVFPSFVSKST